MTVETDALLYAGSMLAAGLVSGFAGGVMTPAVMLAAPLGERVANRFDPHRLRIVFGVFLILIALDMLRNLLG